MNDQTRAPSSVKPNGKSDQANALVKTELGDEELSQVSGGKGASLALACAKGTHLTKVKLSI
jgi:bacteriocin-like protein